jgi:outer membrane biosynthesis protein TonB
VGNGGEGFPEWQRAHAAAKPEDDAQRRFVGLLEQPIDAAETRKLAQRKRQLQALVDEMPQASASRMRQRLADPNDALRQFMTYELSTPLRADLVKRLATREATGSRSIGPQQRGTVTPPVPPPGPDPTQQMPPPAPTLPPAPTQKPKPPPPPPPRSKTKPKPGPPKPADRPRRKPRTKLPPVRKGPDLLDWLEDLLSHSGKTALTVAGLALSIPASALAAALAAAAAAVAGGESLSRAGELAAKEMLKSTLEQEGFDPGRVCDLNDLLRKNFPGLDLISPQQAWQVKVKGITSLADLDTLAGRYVNDMLTLYGAKHWRALPSRTAKALRGAYDKLTACGGWPSALTKDSTDAEIKAYLQKTVFGVPEDHENAVRHRLVTVLRDKPAIRELFPELRLGSLVEFGTLKPAEQNALTKKLQDFSFSRVRGIGVTSGQLRAMVRVGADIATP